MRIREIVLAVFAIPTLVLLAVVLVPPPLGDQSGPGWNFSRVSLPAVAEHDYCGGAAWIGKISVGQGVKLSGPGIDPGIYVADELRYQLRGKAKVSDLPDYDVVLQTCVTKTELVLVGMTRVAPA